jgi:hypothetical protein
MAAWWLVPHASSTTRLMAFASSVGEAHLGAVDVALLAVDAPAEGVLEGARLLEDLLQHEVLVAGLLGHGGRPVDALHGALHRGTGHQVVTVTPLASSTAISPSSMNSMLRVSGSMAGTSLTRSRWRPRRGPAPAATSAWPPRCVPGSRLDSTAMA